MDLEAGVALVVLARDEEAFLEDCYRHHAPYFDFTICLVSRSIDRTEEIAKRNFDRVEVISFPGSFGLLHEHANDISPCRWVLHVDADERFPTSVLLHVRSLAEKLPPGTTLGFPRINPPSYPAPWPDYQYRLMGRETRYVSRVHEMPLGGKRQLPAITENAIIHLAPVARIQAKISRWRSLGDQYWAGVFENTNRYTNMKKYSPELEIREGTSDRAVVEEVIHRRIYLKNFILPFIKHNGLIIDIGAHIGSFTIQACSLLHPKVVLAIEPERDNFSHLIKNVAKARFKKIVHPIQVALWDSPAKKELYCQPANPSMHSLVPSWREWMTNPLRLEPNADAYEIQPVQTDTLDNVLKSVQLEHAKIEVIKIDVEGAEKQVLEGSLEALRRCNIMIGELHEAILSQDELRRQLVDFVVAIGETSTSLRVRTFWAVRKAMLKNKTALREFRRAAKIASLEDTIWKLERETMSQNALAASMMDSLTNQLNLTHSSVSWRISAPIRWIGSILVPKPKSQVKLAENIQIAHVQSGPLGALQNPKVRDIFREIIEERLNNNLLSSYYRLGDRVDSYYIQGHRVSREELAGKIVDFLTCLPKNDPIDAARAFWSEFSFGGGNNAGVPIEVNSIESAYGRICQRTTGVVMIQDLLTQPNLSNGRIVDVGCLSNEFNMAILSQADCNGIRIQKAIGTDIVETTMALNDPRLAFRKQPSSKTLPLESEFADLAILKWTLHHMTLDEVTSITREINRILKPGGKAVLIEALVGQDKELYREFLTECRQKDSWPEGPWQKVRRNITKRYFQLSLDEQKAVLALEDYYGHWLESLRTSMPLPFTYLTRDEIGYHFEVTGMNESTQLRRVFGFAPIIHQGPPSIRLVYEKQSAR